MKSPNKLLRFLSVFIHVIAWGIAILFPIFIDLGNGNPIDWVRYLGGLPVVLCFLGMFYLNYFYLIDRLLFRQRIKRYILTNILLIAAISSGMYVKHTLFVEQNKDKFVKQVVENSKELMPEPHKQKRWMENEKTMRNHFVLLFFFRDIVSLSLIVGLALSIKITRRWYEIETTARELKRQRTEAELKNLRSQINPHFLLNTLNNIYALIAFDTDKAQMAVQDLGKLLRYVLYDNREEYVPLVREAEFVRNYIELMRIRLADNVNLTTTIDVHPESDTTVAPLIFISLIENAFKHGISPIERSHIDIMLRETRDATIGRKIICKITNSNYPKNTTDKSGSGIGLEQVSMRLDLLYHNNFIWRKGVNQATGEYESLLIINADKEPILPDSSTHQ